jgi:hypothetical protein
MTTASSKPGAEVENRTPRRCATATGAQDGQGLRRRPARVGSIPKGKLRYEFQSMTPSDLHRHEIGDLYQRPGPARRKSR